TMEERLALRGHSAAISLRVVLKVWKEMPRYWVTLLRSAVIGCWLGITPGGAIAASFMGYNLAKRFSKDPASFGKGRIEGVFGPETAAHASGTSALLPMLALGIPGSGTAAILLGGLMAWGLNPGPLLFVEHKDYVWGTIASMYRGKAPARQDVRILVEREGRIATVVLNRPEKLNALTKGMWHLLGEAITALDRDESVRCIIIRGAGEKAFSPGNDIGEFATERANKTQATEYGHAMHTTAGALARCRHPLVAQIHGICVGGGLEIAALCDLRICGASSRFGAPIKNLGLVMAYPEMEPLVRLVGAAVALEILLEGRIFDAQEALAKRLVTRVVA